MTTPAPLSYRDILELYSVAQSNGMPPEVTFEQFANLGAQMTGRQEFAQVAQAKPWQNTIRTMNSNLDSAVNSSSLDEWIGSGAGWLFDKLGGDYQTGYEVGSDVPRMMVDALPMMAGAAIGGLLGGPPGVVAGGKIGMAGSGALMALNTYGDTGSAGQAAFSAATPWIGGKLFEGGSSLALKAAQKSPWMQRMGFMGGTAAKVPTTVGKNGRILREGSTLEGRVLETVKDKALSYVGGQAGVGLGFTAVDVAQQGPGILTDPNYLLAQGISQIPFLPMDLIEMRGNRWVGDPKEVEPAVPVTQYTPEEQMTKDFERAFSLAKSEAEKSVMEAQTGMDVARMTEGRRRVLERNEMMRNRRHQIKGELESNWAQLKKEFPGIPELKDALGNNGLLQQFPVAKASMDRYVQQMRQLEKEKKRVIKDLRASPGDATTLFNVAVHEMKLPETLLNKPVEQRTISDYEGVLKGKLTKLGIKMVQDLHRKRAGLEPLYPDMWEKFQRRTKSKEEKEEVVEAAAGVVAQEGKMNDEKLNAIVESEVGKGKTLAEAESKATNALVQEAKKIINKPTGRPKGRTDEVKQRIGKTFQEVFEAGNRADLARGKPMNNRDTFLLNAERHISSIDEGELAIREDLYNLLGRIMEDTSKPGESFAAKYARFLTASKTVVNNRKAKRKEVEIRETREEQQADEEAGNLGKTEDQREFDEEGFAVEEEPTISKEEVADAVVDAAVSDNENAVDVEAAAIEIALQKGVFDLMRTMSKYADMEDAELRKALADLPSSARAQVRNIVAKKLGIKLAAKEEGGINWVSDLLPQGEYVDKILDRLGYSAEESAALRPVVESMLGRFNNPEATYGIMAAEEGVYGAAVNSLNTILFNPQAIESLSKEDKLKSMAFVLAHEHSHKLVDRALKGDFGEGSQKLLQDYRDWITNSDPRNVKDVVEVMKDLWLEDDMKKLPGVEDVLRNLDNANGLSVDEVLANTIGMFAAGTWDKSTRRSEAMLMIPSPLRKVFDWIGSKLQGAWEATRAYLNIGGTNEARAQAKKVEEFFNGLRKPIREAENQMLEAKELLSVFDPANFLDVQYARGRFGPTGIRGKVESLFNNNIMRGADLANTYDFLKVPFDRMASTQEKTASDIAQALAPVFGNLTHLGGLKVKSGPWQTVKRSPSLSALYSKMVQQANMMRTNFVIKDAQGTSIFNPAVLTPELRTELNSFSPQGQQAVKELIVQAEESMGRVQDTVVRNKWLEAEDNLAGFLASNDSMIGRFGEAKEIATGIIQAFQSGEAPKIYDALAKIIDPELRIAASSLGEGYAKLITSLDQGYKASRLFGSLRRYGPYKAYFKKGEEEMLLSFNSPNEAEQRQKALAQEGWTIGRIVRENRKGKQAEYGLDGEMKARIKAQEQQLGRLIDSLAMSEEVREQLKSHLDFSGGIERQIAAKDIASLNVNRKFKKGMEELDMLEQHLLFANAAISQSHKSALRAAVNYGMKHPDAEMYADVTDTFKQIHENFQTPTPEFLRQLSKANAAWFIGYNLPGHMAELAQPLMTHLPELRARGMGLMESMKMIGQSQKEILDFYKKAIKDKLWGTKDEIKLWEYWKDKDERAMLQELSSIDQNPLSSAYQDIGFTQGQLISAIDGKPKTPGELFASPFNWLGNTGLGLYSKFTQHNQISALLTGYRAARKNGMTHEQAVQEARIFNRVVNKTGGKASRQATPFANNGVIGHLVLGLQGYVTGWFGQLATYYRHGFKSKDYPNLSSKDITQAKKAFKTMIIAQLAASGFMGMPFMAAGLKLFEEMTGEDIKGELYRALDEATNDPIISQTATHGLGGTLGEMLGIPVDLHSRFSLGGVGGFNAYDGYSANSLLGPSAGMIEGLWRMGKALVQGEGPRAALAAGGPSGLRNAAKALDENLRNDLGEPADGTDILMTSLGFRSQQLRKEQELRQISTKINESNSRELKSAAAEVTSALAYGPDRARAELHRQTNALLAGYNEQQYKALFVPTLNQLANAVASEIEAKTMPKDLRELARGRNASDVLATAGAMGMQMPSSTEVQRAVLRQTAMRMMGLGRGVSMRSAAMRDQQSALFDEL